MRQHVGEARHDYFRRFAEFLFNDLQSSLIRRDASTGAFSFGGRLDYTYEISSLGNAIHPQTDYGRRKQDEEVLVLNVFVTQDEDGTSVGMEINHRYFSQKLQIFRMLFRSNVIGADDCRLTIIGTWNSQDVVINFRHRSLSRPEASPPTHGLRHPRQPLRRNVDLSEHL